MIVGWPGTAKTGSLACLANAGFKLRILDYDGNTEPLFTYVQPDKLENIDILTFEDKLRAGPQFVEVSGIPTAFADGLKAMDHWKYKDEEGNEVDLGRSKDWGPDTIVVLDSLTSMGDAAKRRAMAMQNRTPLNFRHSDWGLAMGEQEAFIEKMTSKNNRFHVVIISHLKMIGPKDVEKGDDDLTKDLKEQAAELVKTRLFPSALGHALPPKIGGHVPTLILAESLVKGSSVRRILRTFPTPEIDIKVPAPDLPPTLDIADGMLKIFETLTGGIDKCLLPTTTKTS